MPAGERPIPGIPQTTAMMRGIVTITVQQSAMHTGLHVRYRQMTGAQLVQPFAPSWRIPTPGWSSWPARLPTVTPRSRRMARASVFLPRRSPVSGQVLTAVLRTRLVRLLSPRRRLIH